MPDQPVPDQPGPDTSVAGKAVSREDWEVDVLETGPPAFPGQRVGAGLDQLEALATPWMISRTITTPRLAYQLLQGEPGFAHRPRAELTTIANTLTFLFQHTKAWTLLWAESVAGPSQFEDNRRVRCGVSVDQSRQLALAAGIKTKAEGDLWAVSASAEISAEWSKLTNSTVRIEGETEFTRSLTFTVPAGGMDIALWQLESRLTRRLILRPGQRLPDPVPAWVEVAIAVPVRSSVVLTSITRSITRTAGQP